MMAQVAASDREKITDLLGELQTMGLPKDSVFRKTVLSVLDISLDDDLHGLIIEMLENNQKSLVDFIDHQPAWLGCVLMTQYPVLFDSAFKSHLSRHKLNEIQDAGVQSNRLTARANRSILRNVRDLLESISGDNGANGKRFEDYVDEYAARKLAEAM